MSFVELMIALAVVGVAVMVLIQQVTITLHERNEDVEAQFAYRKAIGMVAELQAAIDQGTLVAVEDLDQTSDAELSPLLTTRPVPAPDHVMSANVLLANGSWKWHRKIEVEEIDGTDRSRFVRVVVKRMTEHGSVFTAATASSILNLSVKAAPVVKEYDVYVLALAEAPSLWQPLPALRAQLQGLASEIGGANPNLRFRLHWITRLGYGRDASYTPYVNETTASDAAAPWAFWYPGMLAQGAGASTLYAAELLSGRVRTEAGVLHDYDEQANRYPHAVADRFNHCMRTPAARALFEQRVAAGLEKRDEPPLQLLLADMHAQPERFRNALFVNLHGEGLPFPPLRNYADAARDPAGHPGVRVVTHPARVWSPRGEGAPLADILRDVLALGAANPTSTKVADLVQRIQEAQDDLMQDPPDFSGANGRLNDAGSKVGPIVSAGLLTSAEGDALKLRIDAAQELVSDRTMPDAGTGLELLVYGYKTDPDSGPAVLAEPITVQIMGVDLTANVNGSGASTLGIRRMVGGVDPATGQVTSGAAGDYSHMYDSPGLPPRLASKSAPFEMCYEVGYATTPEPHTWIRLYNTPLVTPAWADEGLPKQHRLYGMEYIPSPVAATPFSIDPDTDGSFAKNTARWQILIGAAALPNADTQLEIRTRIGTDLTTGRMWPTANQPHNLSTTWAWWTDSPQDVPITERFQFLGDPRHNPYADVAAAHGYNWWFDDLRNASVDVSTQWTCLDRTRLHDGFGAGVVEDLPRMLQVWRDALQATGAVFANPGGPLAGKLLLGGEIVLPGTSGVSSPVPLHGAFYDVNGLVSVDDVSGGAGFNPSLGAPTPGVGGGVEPCIGRPVFVNTAGFYTKDWLGELVPESFAEKYAYYGNVPAEPQVLHRQVREFAHIVGLPTATDWRYPSGTTPGDLGGASLLQIGSATATFAHTVSASDEAATLTDDAYALTQAIGVATPRTVPSALPFTMRGQLSAPLPQRADPAIYPDHTGQLLESFAVTGHDGQGSGVIRLAAPANGRVAFFVPFGDTPQTTDQHRALAYKSLALGLRALHVAAEPSRNDNVDPVPLIEIVAPQPQQKLDNPGSVQLGWSTRFARFDRSPYTANYPEGFTGPEMDLGYVVTYRLHGEDEWRYASDDQPATPGVWPEDPLRMIGDISTGDETFVMVLPAGQFPSGDYELRVDCFHRTRAMHVAHHQVQVKIQR